MIFVLIIRIIIFNYNRNKKLILLTIWGNDIKYIIESKVAKSRVFLMKIMLWM
jgi:hypothetical protein